MFRYLRVFIIICIGFFSALSLRAEFPTSSGAVPAHEIPVEIQNIGISEKRGQALPLHLEFTDDEGRVVPLSSYFDQGRPVLLTMVYYDCPNLCNFHLNGLTDVMKKMKAVVGKDYTFVAVSMNHHETSDLAAKKKANYIKALGLPAAKDHWRFLVGS